ncbi:tetratricopeptide repeat protein [Cohnella kolymensis]|uniref:tetratricopeptide repeat protein n=1 Tax=Cohnella kolymensis TaxID=1590652 RepID=UPI000698A184|nr:tetratricopeptide repeat protein [Cohnella kolymensis]
MDGDTCLRQAYEAIFQGDFELALHWFQQAIEIEPDNPAFYYKASITCARSGKQPLAMSYAQKAVDLDPEDKSYQLHLRMMTAKQRMIDARNLLTAIPPNIEQSLIWLKEAVQLDPLSAEARLLLAIGYRIQGDYRRSLECLRDALQLDPHYEEAKRLLHEVRADRRRLIKQQYSHYNPRRNR